ncbi:MAG: hypothetical protein HOH33_02560 [Verrucomicrobia bacterium]|jgi:hypothetical protein|nr:hypothetical protein [Verrucomicrobiota bacterium]
MEASDIAALILGIAKILILGATILMSLVIMGTLLKPLPKQTVEKSKSSRSEP